MACLSPSPSGRRLSELLEEKQEPFLLDIHLLEKGCPSSRLLDGYDTALCWPAGPTTDAAAVLKRLTSKKSKTINKKQQQQQQQKPGGLLKLLLSKILHGKAAGRKPAALQFSDSFKMAAVAPAPPCDDAVKKGEVMEKECYSDSESYSDDDDEKQHSPVSVLEPHPFESSPIHGKLSSPSAMDVFRELLDAATYSPALLTQLLAKSDDLVVKDSTAADDDEDDDDYYYGSYRTSPKNSRYNDAAYWEANRAELARVSELVAAEVPSARLDSAAAVQTERDEVGAGVAAAVLEALLQELVADLGSCC